MVYKTNPHKMRKQADYSATAVAALGVACVWYQARLPQYAVEGLYLGLRSTAIMATAFEVAGYRCGQLLANQGHMDKTLAILRKLGWSIPADIFKKIQKFIDTTYFSAEKDKDTSASYLFMVLKCGSLELAKQYYSASGAPTSMGILAIGASRFVNEVFERYLNHTQYEDKEHKECNQFLNIINDSFFKACTGTAADLLYITVMGKASERGKIVSIIAILPMMLVSQGLAMKLDGSLRNSELVSAPAAELSI